MQFKHQLGDAVTLKLSDETGEVCGRAEYLNTENQYWVLYKCADGRQVSAWWGESELDEPNPAGDGSPL